MAVAISVSFVLSFFFFWDFFWITSELGAIGRKLTGILQAYFAVLDSLLNYHQVT